MDVNLSDLRDVPVGVLLTAIAERGYDVPAVERMYRTTFEGQRIHVVDWANLENPSEPEPETDLDRWLGLWELLDRTNEGRGDDVVNLLDAIERLVTLIQPPSVRVARQVSASSEASSQT